MVIINSIFLVGISAILLWLLYSAVKNRPELFSSKNLNKSFFTMGVLFIILIVVISFFAIILAK